jgi:hypothetical protein
VYGTIDLTEKLIQEDLIKKHGKIVIVGSAMGNINRLASENIKDTLRKEELTLENFLKLQSCLMKQSVKRNLILNEEGGSMLLAK